MQFLTICTNVSFVLNRGYVSDLALFHTGNNSGHLMKARSARFLNNNVDFFFQLINILLEVTLRVRKYPIPYYIFL